MILLGRYSRSPSLRPIPGSGLLSSYSEWVAVILFYAAVHYVNAYLWERYHLTPSNHDQRTHGVHQDTAIRACALAYDILKDNGFYARYAEGFTLSQADARALLDNELRAVEAAVMRALGQPVPAW